MKKAVIKLGLAIVFLGSISCQKEEVKPVKTFWAAIRFKVGTVYKWSESGVKSIRVEVEGQKDFNRSIEGALGYEGSECNAFGFGYMVTTREDKAEACYYVTGDRGEVLAEGVLIFKDPKEEVRL